MDRSQLFAVVVAGALVAGVAVRSLSPGVGPSPATADGGAILTVTAYTVRPGNVAPWFPLADGGYAVAMEACAMLDDGDGGSTSLGCRQLPVETPADLAAADVLNQLAASAFAADGGELDAGTP